MTPDGPAPVTLPPVDPHCGPSGPLLCAICHLPLRVHSIGPCPMLYGERLVTDGPTARMLRRRELRAKT